MKTLLKRMSAGLLALFMVLSLLFAGLPTDIFAATGTLIYNTGTRHDYDVTLSAQAKAYYTGNYTWDRLSSLQGGNTSCLSIDNPLFEALHDLMANTMTNSVSYSSLPNYWAKTDAAASNKNYVLFYSDVAGPDSNMNREHVWPKSHGSFYEKNAGSDLHHLRPTNGDVNSSRGNLIMGNVKGKSGASTYAYGGKTVLYKTSSLCEVNDNIKGDVARILLYVWCRWEEPNLFMNSSSKSTNSSDGGSKNKNDGGKVIESLDTLLEWCETDPVDTWEMNRNDQVENVQGNRNVFIDYPEFAWLVFGQDVPTDLDTPSNNASSGISGKPSGGSTSGSTGGSSASKYTQLSALNNGDKVVIVNPLSSMAFSSSKSGYYNIGVDVSDGFASISSSEIYTATKNSDGTWSFISGDGKKMAMADSYSSLNEDGANDKWELTSAGSNQFYLRNTGRDLYLEWYASKSNWSAYKPDEMSSDYVLAFYTEGVTNPGGSTGGITGGSTGGSSSGSTGGSSGSSTGGNTGGSAGGSTGGSSGGTTTTTPPASQPGASEGQQTSIPSSQPGTSEGTQTSTPASTPATKPAQPAPMATNPVAPPTLPKEDNTATVVIIIVAVAIALLGGGAAVWFFVIKPKKAAVSAEEVVVDAAPMEEISEETPTEETPAEETPAEPTEEIEQ